MKQKLFFVFIAAYFLFTIFIVMASTKASVTEDEPIHRIHGEELYKWYAGGESTAVSFPFDSLGRSMSFTEGPYSKAALNIFGGSFDLICETMYQKLFSTFDFYDIKHALTAFVGSITFLLVGLIVFEITGSWYAAIIGLLVAFLTPRLFGNALSNPKDVPFMTACTLIMYGTIRHLISLPKVKVSNAVLLILGLAFAINIRANALVFMGYVIGFTSLFLVYRVFILKEKKATTLMPFGYTLLICFVGYFGATLIWPWAFQCPFQHPFSALKMFNNFSAFNSYELFEGIHQNDVSKPWYYSLKWILITAPFLLYIGWLLFSYYVFSSFYKEKSNRLLYPSIVFLFFLAPHFFIILNGSNIYNGARHILFTWPPLLVLASLGFYRLYLYLKLKQKAWVFVAFFLLLMYQPLMAIFKENPKQALYFNPIINWEGGAFKRYEIDYWGYANRPALEWLEDSLSKMNLNRKLNVALGYGDHRKISDFIKNKAKQISYIAAPEDSKEWDVYVYMLSQAKNNQAIYNQWPPAGTIYVEGVDGTVVTALVLNPRLYPSASFSKQNLLSYTPVLKKEIASEAIEAFEKGMSLYNQKEFEKGILQFENSIRFGGDSASCYNNIVACYNNLEQYQKAIAVGRTAQQFFPENQLLKNNINWAESQLKK